ncbi:MAG TPA: DUF4410 domain-containing protein [Candidatus Dormibacteraeota bacterium]|nr:DUF4410 domain-containing protein [Candidatus Dormibacteraeota bacterium]
MRQPTGIVCASLIGGLALAACSSSVRITKETDAVGVPKPSAVYVYDFAVDQSEMKADPGGPLQRLRSGGGLLGGGLLGGDSPPPSTQDEQMLALGHQIADQVAQDLVQRITAMGLPAQRISRDQVPPEGAAAVAGQFVDLDEGNRLKRMAIGFHQGQSSVSAAVQLYRVTGTRSAGQLLDFTATGTSPPLPGAAVTMGAGAAVQVAAATAGGKELRDTLSADAGRLSAAVARNLQTFFAKQSWTAPPSEIPDDPF